MDANGLSSSFKYVISVCTRLCFDWNFHCFFVHLEEIILREIAFLSYLVLQGYKGNAHDTLDVNHHKNILTGETIIKSIGFADSAVRVFQAEVFLKR